MNLRKGRSAPAWRRLRAVCIAAILVLATSACFSTPTPQPTALPMATWTPTPRPPAT